MLTSKVALELTRRFACLDGYPRYIEAETELSKAFQRAPDKKAAERFIETWMATSTETPKPVHISEAFKPLRVEDFPVLPPLQRGQEPAPAVHRCALCEDTGWYRVRGVKTFDTPDGERRYDGMQRCHHPDLQRGNIQN